MRQTALIDFILKQQLIDMLIEGNQATKSTLDFEINKEVSLRSLLGVDQFKSLVRATIEVLGKSEDYETCICLLDKIRDTEGVLRTLIKLQFSQIQRTKPLKFVSPVETNHDHQAQYRLFDQY